MEGSEDTSCDVETGQCICQSETITGLQCDKCMDGYYGFPNCEGIVLLISAYNNHFTTNIRSQCPKSPLILIC